MDPPLEGTAPERTERLEACAHAECQHFALHGHGKLGTCPATQHPATRCSRCGLEPRPSFSVLASSRSELSLCDSGLALCDSGLMDP